MTPTSITARRAIFEKRAVFEANISKNVESCSGIFLSNVAAGRAQKFEVQGNHKDFEKPFPSPSNRDQHTGSDKTSLQNRLADFELRQQESKLLAASARPDRIGELKSSQNERRGVWHLIASFERQEQKEKETKSRIPKPEDWDIDVKKIQEAFTATQCQEEYPSPLSCYTRPPPGRPQRRRTMATSSNVGPEIYFQYNERLSRDIDLPDLLELIELESEFGDSDSESTVSLDKGSEEESGASFAPIDRPNKDEEEEDGNSFAPMDRSEEFDSDEESVGPEQALRDRVAAVKPLVKDYYYNINSQSESPGRKAQDEGETNLAPYPASSRCQSPPSSRLNSLRPGGIRGTSFLVSREEAENENQELVEDEQPSHQDNTFRAGDQQSASKTPPSSRLNSLRPGGIRGQSFLVSREEAEEIGEVKPGSHNNTLRAGGQKSASLSQSLRPGGFRGSSFLVSREEAENQSQELVEEEQLVCQDASRSPPSSRLNSLRPGGMRGTSFLVSREDAENAIQELVGEKEAGCQDKTWRPGGQRSASKSPPSSRLISLRPGGMRGTSFLLSREEAEETNQELVGEERHGCRGITRRSGGKQSGDSDTDEDDDANCRPVFASSYLQPQITDDDEDDVASFFSARPGSLRGSSFLDNGEMRAVVQRHMASTEARAAKPYQEDKKKENHSGTSRRSSSTKNKPPLSITSNDSSTSKKTSSLTMNLDKKNKDSAIRKRSISSSSNTSSAASSRWDDGSRPITGAAPPSPPRRPSRQVEFSVARNPAAVMPQQPQLF